MDNKLSELSKPAAWTSARSLDVRRKITAFTDVESAAEYASANCWEKIVPLYSQEYVSALLAERDAFEASALALRDEWRARGECIAELEQAMRHIHGALLDITVPRAAIAKAAELAVEHAAMKEQSNG